MTRVTATLMRRRALQTLGAPVEVAGVGLHSGKIASVRMLPSAKPGIQFLRSDQNAANVVMARPESVTSTLLSTTIGSDYSSVRTIEHLMAADLYGFAPIIHLSLCI